MGLQNGKLDKASKKIGDNSMNIIIGADLVPTESNFELFEKGDIDTLIGNELKDIIFGADYRIFNLEVPLVNETSPIKKCGPNLIAPTKCVSAYRAMEIDMLTLANNHILDQGEKGLESSISTLKEAGISYIGVGNSIREASRPRIIGCDGKKIGIYACAEHEFTIATSTSAGANPVDFLETPDDIADLKAQCDHVIVLYHGGKEHYRYPSPNLQKICRKLVKKGADLVVCQHSHCIGCEEKYENATIVYGQGNFLFDDDDNEYWQTSLLISLDNDFKVNYIPLVKKDNTVRIADEENVKKIMEEYQFRSEQIKDQAFVENEYERFAQDMLNHYLRVLTGKKRTLLSRIINKLTRGKWEREFANRLSEKYRLATLNVIECEPHRELFIRGIKGSYKGR